MLEPSPREVAVTSRIGFAFVAALAGWAVAWCVACFYFAAMPVILNRPRYPAPPDIAVIYLLCTFIFVFGMTLVFGAPYVAIRTTAGMLQRPWRFYVETGLAGIVAISVFNVVLMRPQVESPMQTLVTGLPIYGGFSLVTTAVTSFVYLRWLRSRQRLRVEN